MREVDGERVRMIRRQQLYVVKLKIEIVRRDTAPVPVVK